MIPVYFKRLYGERRQHVALVVDQSATETDVDPVAFAREILNADDHDAWASRSSRDWFAFDAHCVEVRCTFSEDGGDRLQPALQAQRLNFLRRDAWRRIADRLASVFESKPAGDVFGRPAHEASFVAMRSDDFRELRAYVRELERNVRQRPVPPPIAPNPGPSLKESFDKATFQ